LTLKLTDNATQRPQSILLDIPMLETAF